MTSNVCPSDYDNTAEQHVERSLPEPIQGLTQPGPRAIPETKPPPRYSGRLTEPEFAGLVITLLTIFILLSVTLCCCCSPGRSSEAWGRASPEYILRSRRRGPSDIRTYPVPPPPVHAVGPHPGDWLNDEYEESAPRPPPHQRVQD
ncbi:uncharacterized protein EI97DRAFT_79894 [Westerdykella ornata]|uniref:Uncharacterized protein n=1 Tax=Westerdykella ornata TaxID=318751 RepID=A0A6A6JGV2_WESOR|nr:uncharacterized protein EI97DRAFT_79894 [Westerdykella ornata]KAF2275198.1 hypothetical protein EI97DRAFT_79894 [Westerdykella ornata]